MHQENSIMEELIRMVSQKIGVSEDQAKTAVHTVVGFIKDKLPAPIASQIDGVIGGGGNATGEPAGGLGEVAKGIGGMFGG
jgi:hypothetical protein